MFKKKDIKGYVVLEITGSGCDRFLNLCVQNDITLRKVTNKGVKLNIEIDIKDFKKVSKLSRKSGTKIKIIKKEGLPFFVFKHRKRKAFAIALLISFIAIKVLSFFIWSIEVNGYHEIPKYEIVGFLNELDVKGGTYSKKVKPIYIENELLKKYPRISWVNVFVDGTTLVVDLSENREQKELVEKNVPTDIVANKSAEITSLNVISGISNKKVGDYVKEDEVIVTGLISSSEEEAEKKLRGVTANADIEGVVTYNYDFEVKKNTTKKVLTGKSRSEYYFIVFGKQIKLFGLSNKYDLYEKSESRKQLELTEKHLLPFIYKKVTYNELIEQKVVLTEKELQREANIKLNNKTIQLAKDGDIINKSVISKKTSQGIHIYSIIAVSEKLGEKKEVTIMPTIEEEPKSKDKTNNASN